MVVVEMPKDKQKKIQKRLKIVKDMFKVTKETKQILEGCGYSENNIFDLVKEIRGYQ